MYLLVDRVARADTTDQLSTHQPAGGRGVQISKRAYDLGRGEKVSREEEPNQCRKRSGDVAVWRCFRAARSDVTLFPGWINKRARRRKKIEKSKWSGEV